MMKKICIFFGVFLSGCSSHYAAQSQATPRYASVEQGQIEYYRIGKGSPIVLIPGYATDATSWNRDFLAELSEQHELIILNNRNVSGSRFNTTQYSSKALANDVDQLIRHLRLQKPAVLGISMGGMIAQQVAAQHPKDVGQLILINTAISGHKSVRPNKAMEEKMLNIPASNVGFYHVAVNSFFPTSWKPQAAYSLANDRFKPGVYHEIDRQAVTPQQRELLMTWANDNATAKKLGKLPVPTLVLNGEADIVIPPVNSVILAKTIPHAQLIRWKDGGHAMIYQYPTDIAESINDFIKAQQFTGEEKAIS